MISYEAEKIIKNHVILAMGLSAIPVPMIDLVLIYHVQKDMIKQLNRAYAKDYYELRNKAYISVIASTSFARLGSSLIKTIPGVGSIIGGVSSAVINGATTYALGKVTARFFHENIELSDIDMDLAKEFFKEEFEIGKMFASNLAQQKKEQKDRMDLREYARQEAKEKEILQKLITLKKLFEDDLITEEEYDEKRGKFVDQLDISNFKK